MTDCIRKSHCHGESRRGGLEQLLVNIAQKSAPCCSDLLLLQMVSLSDALRSRNATHSLVYGRWLPPVRTCSSVTAHKLEGACSIYAGAMVRAVLVSLGGWLQCAGCHRVVGCSLLSPGGWLQCAGCHWVVGCSVLGSIRSEDLIPWSNNFDMAVQTHTQSQLLVGAHSACTRGSWASTDSRAVGCTDCCVHLSDELSQHYDRQKKSLRIDAATVKRQTIE